MSPLQVGTQVMVVRTRMAIDGATGEVRGPLRWRLGWCACGCGLIALGRGYQVELARPVRGCTDWTIAREHLIPLTPPDDAIEDQRVVDAPADERIAA